MHPVGPVDEHRLEGSQVRAAVQGIAAGLIVATLGFALLDPFAREDANPEPGRHTARPNPLPEGRLLLLTDEGPAVVGRGLEGPVHVAGGEGDPTAYSLSSDGSQMLGALSRREPTGIIRKTMLLVIDVESGERSVLVRAHRREDLGPAAWSPNGKAVAYRLTTYDVDPAKTYPGPENARSTLCVLRASGEREPRCFPRFRNVSSFDWSPDGRTIAVGGVEFDPLRLLDPGSGRSTVLLSSGAVSADLGLTGENATLSVPRWSASGRRLSALADLTPVIVRSDGELVATGRGMVSADAMLWSPTADALGYARGKRAERLTEIRLMRAGGGKDRRLFSAKGESYGFIGGMAWSPSGRWLAVLRLRSPSETRVDILDVTGEEPTKTLDLSGVSAVIDWSP